MGRRAIQHLKLSEYLSISECPPDMDSRFNRNEWFVYDTRASWNIGSRQASRDEAFVKAIDYWAERALQSERCYADLKMMVDQFVANVHDCEICECED